jgi:YD repeat-containing protein
LDERQLIWQTGSSTQYNYDATGNVAGVEYRIDGDSHRFSYTYDLLGRLLSMTYPDGDIIGTPTDPMQYDTAGRLQAIPGIAHSLRYTANGEILTRANDNGTIINNTYSLQRGWLQSTQALHDGNVVHNLQYAYRVDGLPQEIKNPEDNRTFAYDTLGRLIAASGETISERYVYSHNGNILQNGKATLQYPVAGTPKPHAVKSVGDNVYTYDANGNMLSGAGRTIEWGANNQPTRINNSYFSYDANGKRFKKIENGQKTIYLGDTVELTNGVFTKYISVAGKIWAKRVGTQTSWLYTDQQGTVQAIEEDDGNVTRQKFASYGSLVGHFRLYWREN